MFTVQNYKVQLKVCESIEIYPPVTSAEVISEIAGRLGLSESAQEQIAVICLNTSRLPVGVNIVGIGKGNECSVNPADVFRFAINCPTATSIALVHNHPSGRTDPSRADIDMTMAMIKAGNLLGIPVVDHVIVSFNGFTSMRSGGYLNFA